MLRSLIPCLTIVATLLTASVHAQEKHVTLNSRDLKPGERIDGTPLQAGQHPPVSDRQAYDAWKRAQKRPSAPPVRALVPPQQPAAGSAKGGGLGQCDCWVEPTSIYHTIDNDSEWGGNPDDGSYEAIELPFSFFLYGQTWSEAYININGNVSFGEPYSTYTSTGFPVSGFTMVAPFWSDVDLAGTNCTDCNKVQYRLTPTALYVNWTRVGYFDDHTDKLNTFQLIITDGTDPVIPNGANVSFCYKDMQWTEGDVTGDGGFGGEGASVGANHGNGTDYMQFGVFDHAGTDYDGPEGANDGISWLDNQYFTFATDVTTGNVPPVLSGQSVCNYLPVCTNQPVNLSVSFISPEPDQTTVATSSAPGFPDYTIVSNTSGQTAVISTTFTPTTPGMYQVVFQGSDDGTPALTSTLTINIEVFQSPAGMPVIAGELTACDGQGTVLSVQGGTFVDYEWSNGYQGPQVLVGPGVYTVSAGEGTCLLTSAPITVTAAPSPSPVIDGVLFTCGGDLTELSTTEPYPTYSWSNGAQTPTVSVGTGTYSVTVTNDGGCSATSAPVYVNTANSPSSSFYAEPSGDLLLVGTTVVYTSTAQANGTTIVSAVWNIEDLFTSTDGTISYTYDQPGSYTVTLTLTTSDGCVSVYTLEQVIVPAEIQVPNVFTPNGDAYNQTLEFAGAEFYPNTQLNVFDRWGKEVFSSQSYKNTWQGTDMPEGTYFYVLKLMNGKDYKGQVTLLR